MTEQLTRGRMDILEDPIEEPQTQTEGAGKGPVKSGLPSYGGGYGRPPFPPTAEGSLDPEALKRAQTFVSLWQTAPPEGTYQALKDSVKHDPTVERMARELRDYGRVGWYRDQKDKIILSAGSIESFYVREFILGVTILAHANGQAPEKIVPISEFGIDLSQRKIGIFNQGLLSVLAESSLFFFLGEMIKDPKKQPAGFTIYNFKQFHNAWKETIESGRRIL